MQAQRCWPRRPGRSVGRAQAGPAAAAAARPAAPGPGRLARRRPASRLAPATRAGPAGRRPAAARPRRRRARRPGSPATRPGAVSRAAEPPARPADGAATAPSAARAAAASRAISPAGIRARLPASGRGFRPRAGESGGSAARQHPPAAPASRGRSKIKFGGSQPATPVSRGQRVSSAAAAPGAAGPRIRTGRQPLQPPAGRPSAGVPRLHFRTAAAPSCPAAAPRCRDSAAGLPAAPVGPGLRPGRRRRPRHQRRSVPRRRRRGTPAAEAGQKAASRRGRSAARRRSALRRPAIRTGKQPQIRVRPAFGAVVPDWPPHRRPPDRRPVAGRQRVGSRSGVWLIGRRTGGMR